MRKTFPDRRIVERAAPPPVRPGIRLPFEDVADRCPAGIAVIEASGAISYTNRRAQAMLLFKPDEHNARNYNSPQWSVTDFKGRPLREDELIFSQVMARGIGIDDVEHVVLRDDGVRLYLRISGQPLFDETGRMERVIFTMMDVSAGVLAERAHGASERSYRELVNQLNEGVARLDQDLETIRFVNPRMADMLGYRAEELVGTSMYALVSEGLRAEVRAHLAQRRTGKREQYDFQFLHKDGSTLYVNIAAAPLTDDTGAVIGAIGAITDVTERHLAELATRELNARHEATLAALSEGVTVTDTSGVVRFCNASAERILGLSGQQLVGDPKIGQRERFTDDAGKVLDADERPVGASLRTGQPSRDVVLRTEDPQGRVRWLLVNSQPLRLSAAEAPYAAVASFTDISSLKETELALRNSEAQFAGALEYAPIGMALVSLEGRFTLVNQALCQITGYDKAELEKLTFQEITHPDDLAADLGHVGELLAGKISHYQMEKRYLRKDGRIVWIQLSASILRDKGGAPLQFIAQIQDIMASRAAQAALADLARNLTRSNKDLEQFAYAASHDLQAPLRGIVGFAQLLQRSLEGRLDAKQAEFLGFIVSGSQRMHALIAGTLAYSRVGHGDDAIERVDCAGVLAEVLDNFRKDIIDREAQVSSDPLPPVRLTRLEMQQLFQNLVGNALKFQPGLRPKVHIGARSEREICHFWVKDAGIGIPKDQQQRIFQMFARLHPDPVYEGSGIGLSICQKIVERHGGRIWVESDPSDGATFNFTLPAA